MKKRKILLKEEPETIYFKDLDGSAAIFIEDNEESLIGMIVNTEKGWTTQEGSFQRGSMYFEELYECLSEYQKQFNYSFFIKT